MTATAAETGLLTLDFRESLTPPSAALAARFGAADWGADFYLAGSAALALYLGHRPVRDLDLMSNANRLTPPDRRDLLGALLDIEPGTEVETARDGYLFVRMPGAASGAGVGVRFFYYPYPLADAFEEIDGLSVASAVDLGLMKLGAIISRGTRRDFVDLYLLCQRLPLDVLLARAEDKFGHVRDFPLQALKGLADFSSAVDEPMPKLAHSLDWSEVESWFAEQVRILGREHAGLG
ncbi:MAG TPA: nucleotidyl transferase AbiEii/AbiGii toxin family protein [Thermoanaerobaculia bacterium]|nr:nucleotidyl transferase AbiEii/AbiGii toxin family protein [Thermoanaerobaculia bacterium]